MYVCLVCAYTHSPVDVRILRTHKQTCMHEETLVHVRTNVYMHSYVSLSVFVCIHLDLLSGVRACVYVFMHDCTCVCVCVCARARVLEWVSLCKCRCTCIHKCIIEYHESAHMHVCLY